MDMSILAPMLSIAVFFLIVMTRMWESSISTVIHGLSVAIAAHVMAHIGVKESLIVIFVGVLINMLRAVVNTERDRIIKRSV